MLELDVTRTAKIYTMGLDKYIEKRDFTKTSEPASGKSSAKGRLRFVVQKHDASHLHYDFRLEMEGVLKSWAVPKGPSMDPEVKRLAMMVEDHPYDYRTFEGVIPKGQYGGGTVMVWDEGTYEAVEGNGKTRKEKEKSLMLGLKAGKLKIKLEGRKLKGEFALVKAYGRGENSWLLMKLDDDFAMKEDITLQDLSVQSGRSLEMIAEHPERVYGQKDEEGSQRTEAPAKVEKIMKAAGKKASMPKDIKPMLATLVDEPFDDPDWIYEIKWDGYRALAFLNGKDVEISSRNTKSFNDKFYPVLDALKALNLKAVIDGEIVVLNDKGVSNFSALQNWRSEADGHLVFYVFDILWHEGKDLTHLPLYRRQEILQDVLPDGGDMIRLSKPFKTSGTEFFAAAEKANLEGIMAKKADSTYSPGLRSKEWLKVKVHKRQEVIIGGYTKNAGTSKAFSALLLGVYENGLFKYVGKVGTGFSDKLQKQMMESFKSKVIDRSPFETEPDYNKPSRFRPNPPKANATWLKPELVCEVSFSEVTEDGVFRHPSFKGMREDKKAKDVVREVAQPAQELIEQQTDMEKHKAVYAPKNKGRKTLLNPTEETQVKKVVGKTLKFTNLSKVYWPEDGVTKRDVFNFYYQIAEYILPYLRDRPQSLNRFPGGIHGPSFYQKNVKDKAPEWAETFPYTTSEGENKEFLVAKDDASLLWMASLGCIEMNPWFSRIQSPDNPDYCVIDLDPDQNTFEQVIEAACQVKQILDAIEVPAWCKTSGSTGIHIYIPLGAKYTYDQSQLFARLIVNIVQQELPEFTTLERQIKNRNGKMYLDFLQNRPGATIACPYSLRPKPGATVSMPLHWDEVKPGLKMKDFTIHNSLGRVHEVGDLFKGVLGKGIDLEKVVKKAKEVFDQ